MKHPGVALLVVTGGPGVVKAAMAEREEGHLRRAGQSALRGGRDGRHRQGRAGHRGRGELRQQRGVHLREGSPRGGGDRRPPEGGDARERRLRAHGSQIEAVTRLGRPRVAGPAGRRARRTRTWWARTPRSSPRAAGIEVPAGTRLLLMEVGRNHPLVWTSSSCRCCPWCG